MAKSDNNPELEVTFVQYVGLALIITATAFGVYAFATENGQFAIASSICLASLFYGSTTG